MDIYYSVKQIADMLETNPETVRRWIRDKKINSIQDSKKTGSYVSKIELENFARKVPKYATALARYGFSVPLIGVQNVLGIQMQNGISDMIDTSKFTLEELERYVKNEIENRKLKIRTKENEIERIKLEIEKENNKINELNFLLESKGGKRK